MKGRKTGGRKRGTPNKITGDAREMILNAMQKLGGEAYLVKQGRENPAAFLALFGKVVPKEGTLHVQTSMADILKSIDGADTGLPLPIKSRN